MAGLGEDVGLFLQGLEDLPLSWLQIHWNDGVRMAVGLCPGLARLEFQKDGSLMVEV